MPSTMTKLEVWNLAIDVIKDTALRTTDETAATARWLERNWGHTTRSALRKYPWNFAKRYVSLPVETEAPPFGWTKAYKPPPGWLRVLPPRRGGSRYGKLIPHEIVGPLIYTNESAPLKVVLIMDKTDSPAEWDDLFVEIVRCQLALGMANKFTGKNKFIELASQMLATAQTQAESIDTFEGSAEPIEQFDILEARGGSSYGTGSYGRGTFSGEF